MHGLIQGGNFDQSNDRSPLPENKDMARRIQTWERVGGDVELVREALRRRKRGGEGARCRNDSRRRLPGEDISSLEPPASPLCDECPPSGGHGGSLRRGPQDPAECRCVRHKGGACGKEQGDGNEGEEGMHGVRSIIRSRD